ncbi:uncharacterized protein SPSK_09815 [Sporothrix schenckii 1099-18]|uniref:Uncharacterized protein n=1 Tax=Sporothrix schenckii 1099-18 TaxID=1397361 RepID=A0A0F2M515_SPOSC|nr:uncharacterized protein SPSK_09815 [Sporothrix schenckii 1099-18]KJR84793.1 hypothetical protein SPSK_09815 [Sporothrix schenckii 1099-18]
MCTTVASMSGSDRGDRDDGMQACASPVMPWTPDSLETTDVVGDNRMQQLLQEVKKRDRRKERAEAILGVQPRKPPDTSRQAQCNAEAGKDVGSCLGETQLQFPGRGERTWLWEGRSQTCMPHSAPAPAPRLLPLCCQGPGAKRGGGRCRRETRNKKKVQRRPARTVPPAASTTQTVNISFLGVDYDTVRRPTFMVGSTVSERGLQGPVSLFKAEKHVHLGLRA